MKYHWKFIYENHASMWSDTTYPTKGKAFAGALKTYKKNPTFFNREGANLCSIVVRPVPSPVPEDAEDFDFDNQ